MATVGINFGDRERNFGHLPETHLFHIAANDSAMPEYRRYAVELMLEKGYKSADKPELAAIRESVLKARAAAGDPIVPLPAEASEKAAEFRAFQSSITTASLSQEPEVIDNLPKGPTETDLTPDDHTDFPPVQIMDKPQAPEESATETAVQEAAPTSTSDQNQLQPTETQE